MNIPPKVIVVAGPTASGKTRLAIELAGLYMGEICEEFFKMGFKDINVYKDNFNDKRVTVIEFNKIKFIVGIRAYSYIVKLMNVKVYKSIFSRIELADDKIYFVSGLFSEPIGEDYEDRISDKVEQEGKEPFELFCLNFMYNVLCKYGYELSDFSAAAYDFCNAYQYIIRDENDNILFEGEIDWDLREIID